MIVYFFDDSSIFWQLVWCLFLSVCVRCTVSIIWWWIKIERFSYKETLNIFRIVQHFSFAFSRFLFDNSSNFHEWISLFNKRRWWNYMAAEVYFFKKLENLLKNLRVHDYTRKLMEQYYDEWHDIYSASIIFYNVKFICSLVSSSLSFSFQFRSLCSF